MRLRLRARWVFAAACLVLAVPGFAVAQRAGGERREPVAKPAPEAGLERFREGEERRRARRVSPEARAERRRSRTAFRGQGRGEALALAREEHRELIEAPVWEPLDLPAGARVERFFGEFGAQVVGEGGRRSAVDSTLPLRSDVGDGPKRLADLGLVDRGGALIPENPLVQTRIPKRPMDGIEVGGDGFTVGLQSPSSSQAELVEGRAFVANALADTDMVVAPTPRGVQISLQVRSADAPEEAVLPLDLPAGASLRLVEAREGAAQPGSSPAGSVEVVRGQEVLGSILAPMGWDADGQPLEGVGYELREGEVVVRFPHRSKDLLYPLAVDPQVDRFRIDELGRPTGNGSYLVGHGNDLERAAWNYNFGGYGSDGYFGKPYQEPYNFEHNGPLALVNTPGRYYENNSLGQWYWQAPRQSWIYRADFVNLYSAPTYGAEATCVLEGVFSVTRLNWEPGSISEPTDQNGNSRYFGPTPWSGGPAPQGSCSPHSYNSKSHGLSSPTPGNISVYRQFAYGNGVRYRQAYTQLDGAAVHLDDGQAPSVSSATSSPGGWVRSATISTSVAARDAAPGTPAEQGGLGMLITALVPPTENGSALLGQFANCHMRVSRCPESQAFGFSYSTDADLNAELAGVQRVREGAHAVTGDAYDATGKRTPFTAGTLRIDRSVPTAAVGGLGADELLRDRDYTITGNGSDPISGVQSVVVKLDDEEKARRSPTSNPCPTGANVTCSASFTLEGSDQTLTAGQHTIQTTTTDLAGNTQTATRSFRVERTAPTVDVEGSSLMPEGGVWVAKGEQDLLFDAYDEGTGVVRAELRIDGNLIDAVDQDCATDGCELSHDFYTTTDGLSEGEHTVTALAIDAAGNTGREQQTIRLERGAPSLALSGSLKAAEGQTLEAGQTYQLTASGSDAGGSVMQSGLGALEFAADGNEIEIQEQRCEMGGCGMSRTFQYVVDDYGQGPHTISVTATDIAGNETVESFQVGNPEPPAPSCGPLPPAPATGLPIGLAPTVVEQLFRGVLPAAFEPSSEATFLDQALRPALDATQTSEFRATDTLAQATFDRDASDGVTTEVQTDEESSCFTPTAVSAGASEPRLAGEAAALYANSHQSTDTLVRPSATGAFNLTQIRELTAPTAISWDIALRPGEQLEKLADGTVAVIEPGGEDADAPEMVEGLPAPPTTPEQQQAIKDTGLQLQLASDALERAQGDNADRVIGLIPPPWAEDNIGQSVATSLDVSGSTITMQIAHSALTPYPVVAGHEYVSRDKVDEYETLNAATSIGDYAWGETEGEPEEGGAASSGISSQSAIAADDEPVGPEEESLDGLGADALDDMPELGDDDGGPVATASKPRLTDDAVRRIAIGITAADPATITHPSFRGPTNPAAPGADPLNARFVRPFARWNIITKPNNSLNTQLWREWAATAQDLGVRGDVTITTDAPLGVTGVTKNFTARQYRDALIKFLAAYGRQYNPDGSVRQEGVVDNLMAWNEPQYEGTGREVTGCAKRNGQPCTNDGNPLKRKPILAGRLWVQAMAACFPQGAVRPRCGHHRSDGQFEVGRVVAGEFAGKPKDRALKLRGRRLAYTTHYHDEILRLGKKRQPKVWSFHDYGDFKIHALRTGRKRERAPIMNRYHRTYRHPRYEYQEPGGADRKPTIWLAEAGAIYHFTCAVIREAPDRRRFCGGADRTGRISLFGMARQRNAVAFMLRKIATDFPGIKRIYYLNLRTGRGKCGPVDAAAPNKLRCAKNEFGLLGASDEAGYYARATSANPDPVFPAGTGPGDYTQRADQRRLAFCILRDGRSAQVRKPQRVHRGRCPG